MKLLTLQFSPVSFHFVLLSSKCLLQQTIHNTLSLYYSSLRASHPHKVGKIRSRKCDTCSQSQLCFDLLRLNETLTLSNPIFLPTAYSPALIYCGRERGWWITCWLKSILYEEKCRTGSYSGAGEQKQKKKCRTSPDIGAERENQNVGRGPT